MNRQQLQNQLWVSNRYSFPYPNESRPTQRQVDYQYSNTSHQNAVNQIHHTNQVSQHQQQMNSIAPRQQQFKAPSNPYFSQPSPRDQPPNRQFPPFNPPDSITSRSSSFLPPRPSQSPYSSFPPTASPQPSYSSSFTRVGPQQPFPPARAFPPQSPSVSSILPSKPPYSSTFPPREPPLSSSSFISSRPFSSSFPPTGLPPFSSSLPATGQPPPMPFIPPHMNPVPIGQQPFISPVNFSNLVPIKINTTQPPAEIQTFESFMNLIEVMEKTQQEIDMEWISSFLTAKGKLEMPEKKKSELNITIPEVRTLLYHACILLNQLSHVRNDLKDSLNVNEETWKSKLKFAFNIKDKVQLITENLVQEQVTMKFAKKLQKIRKKRSLQKKQREKRKREKLEEESKRSEINRQIDCWMEREKEKVLKEKREEELKIEADNILSEVRRKIQEGKKEQEKLRLLEKLRQARKDTAKTRGLHVSIESDEAFKTKISDLKNIIQKQLIDYDAEEKALKVMLETEQEGQREQEELHRKERQEKLLNKMQNEISECLFGESRSIDPMHPLWYFYQHYNQAEGNLNALIQIRHQWDVHLVRPSDTRGTNIPVNWVAPEPPTSDFWAAALKMNET